MFKIELVFIPSPLSKTFPPFYLLSHWWHHYPVIQARNLGVILNFPLSFPLHICDLQLQLNLFNIFFKFQHLQCPCSGLIISHLEYYNRLLSLLVTCHLSFSFKIILHIANIQVRPHHLSAWSSSMFSHCTIDKV